MTELNGLAASICSKYGLRTTDIYRDLEHYLVNVHNNALERAIVYIEGSTFLKDDRVMETVGTCVAMIRSQKIKGEADEGK